MRRSASTRGEPPTLLGQTPWGYRLSSDRTKLVADPAEQRVAAVARHMRAQGFSLAEIVERLESLDARNRRGQPFNVNGVHDLLYRAGRQGVAHPETLEDPVDERHPASGVQTVQKLRIPAFARGYLLAEISLTRWTRRALERAGYRTLGHLHGKSASELSKLRGVNAATVEELVHVIDAVRSTGPKLQVPLLATLDDALERLQPRLRDVLLLRLGGTPKGCLTLPETAHVCGLRTGEAARQREVRALADLRAKAGPVFGVALRRLAARGDGALADALAEPRRRCAWARPGFYERLLERLGSLG